MGFFSKAKIKSSEILEQAINYISKRYDQAGSTFSIASPFGQLLAVIANMCELIFSYISHTAEELNIQTAQNHESIFGLSRLTGHDPFRGSSAYGKFTIKLNSSAPTILNGNNILIINNFTKLRISETGENYFLNLPSDYVKLSTTSNDSVEVLIMQGEIESQTFTSDGTALQTFNPIVKTMTDHDNVAVTVNGKEWKKVDSLYDMPADGDDEDSGECFMVKSSINVGLTIIFGNGDFGKIPPSGAEIIVTYIKTAGSNGNVYSSDMKVTFLDAGYDETGMEVNLNDVLDIVSTDDSGNKLTIPPTLGADYETPEFTKLIAPKISKSYVLANPDNFTTFLSRYNQFSFIYAYNTKDDDNYYADDNITYLKVLPNIKRKIGSGEDYFSLMTDYENNFKLSDADKDSLASAIQNSGRQLIGTEVSLVDVNIQRFVINVIIRYFESASKQSIRTNIQSILSKYFLNINRNDIIPVSDLIALIEGIDGVDTCDVFFILKKNEDAKINGYYTKKSTVYKQCRFVQQDEIVECGGLSGDPRIGFDSFGNIITEDNEIYIPCGGWYDSDGHYYTPGIETGKLGPLNIFFLSAVEYNKYNQSMQKKLNNLLNASN